MNIDRYIAELLFDHECVIVPGLGGFIINERHATIDRITHQFNPPFKKILFNQHIRFNDGLLVNHIASKEGLSFEVVRKQIDELVLQYFTKLENGEKIKFENIGILAFDKNKNISFDHDNSVNYNAESFGLGSFVSPPIKRKIEVEPVKGIVQPQPVLPKREDRKPEREIAEDLKPIHKRRNKSESASLRSLITVSLVAILLASFAFAYFYSEPSRNYLQNLASSFSLKKEQKLYTPRTEQKKEIIANQAGFLSGNILEIETPGNENISKISLEEIQAEKNYMLGEISVANYMNYRGRNLTEKAEATEVETEVEEPENIIEEHVEVAEVSPPAVKEETVVKIKSTKQYYIIAGSFSDESNALSLIDELLKKGFTAQIIDTNKNGMYRVAYLGIENLTDAKQKLYAIRKEDNPEAWILKK
ncbi:MAG TPA: SPOR domain-containing protein [Bacteroidales bacterium]